jgi:hypothetical protein
MFLCKKIVSRNRTPNKKTNGIDADSTGNKKTIAGELKLYQPCAEIHTVDPPQAAQVVTILIPIPSRDHIFRRTFSSLGSLGMTTTVSSSWFEPSEPSRKCLCDSPLFTDLVSCSLLLVLPN